MTYYKKKKNKTLRVILGITIVISAIGILLYTTFNNTRNVRSVDNSDLNDNIDTYNLSHNRTEDQIKEQQELIRSFNINQEDQNALNQTLDSLTALSNSIDSNIAKSLEDIKDLKVNNQKDSEVFKEKAEEGIYSHIALLEDVRDYTDLIVCVNNKFKDFNAAIDTLNTRISNLNNANTPTSFTASVQKVNSSIGILEDRVKSWFNCWEKYQDQPWLEITISPISNSAFKYFQDIKNNYDLQNGAVQNNDLDSLKKHEKNLIEINKNQPNLITGDYDIDFFLEINKNISDQITKNKQFTNDLRNLQDEIINDRE